MKTQTYCFSKTLFLTEVLEVVLGRPYDLGKYLGRVWLFQFWMYLAVLY